MTGMRSQEGVASPILFLVFNRPDLTEKVFSAVRAARPSRLYLAADGPRKDRPGEEFLCQKVRKIATNVDWPCEVQTLFREKNLGCGRAVKEAIDWFFEQEEEGIILEDDCLPQSCFFRYAENLLERFRTDDRVSMISGFNGANRCTWTPSGIKFTIIPHIWAWATWRRSWRGNFPDRSEWIVFRDSKAFASTVAYEPAMNMWRRQINEFFEGKIDTWDLPWIVKIWMAGQLSISPGVNLVENIGFDERGTHTQVGNPSIQRLEQGELQFPLCVGEVNADRGWERSVYENTFDIERPNLRKIVKTRLRKWQLWTQRASKGSLFFR